MNTSNMTEKLSYFNYKEIKLTLEQLRSLLTFMQWEILYKRFSVPKVPNLQIQATPDHVVLC